MSRRRNELTPTEALHVALLAVGNFHGYVQQADAKVATVATVHLGAAAVAATQTGFLSQARGPQFILAIVLMAVFAAGFLMAGYHLIQGLRPRLHGPDGRNRFGLSGTLDATSRATAAEQEREAWLLVSRLAELSREKHRRVGRALPWTALMLVAMLAWLGLGAFYA